MARSISKEEYEDLRKIVQNESETRLCEELKRGQNDFSSSEIDNLMREEPVKYCILLRMFSGDKLSVKTLLPNFDPIELEKWVPKPKPEVVQTPVVTSTFDMGMWLQIQREDRAVERRVQRE